MKKVVCNTELFALKGHLEDGLRIAGYFFPGCFFVGQEFMYQCQFPFYQVKRRD